MEGDFQLRRRLLNEGDWKPYVCMYSKGYKSNVVEKCSEE